MRVRIVYAALLGCASVMMGAAGSHVVAVTDAASQRAHDNWMLAVEFGLLHALAAVALADLFLRLLRGAHDGADYGDVESNGDGSPDARGDVRTVARDGGAVLRADDGHLCAIGRADGHGAALAFGSADGRALDAPRATASRNPSSSSSSSSSSPSSSGSLKRSSSSSGVLAAYTAS